MVKFEKVDPENLPSGTSAGRGSHGRISGSIIQMFMETGYYMAKLDRTGITMGAANLRSSLRSYAIGHNIPIEIDKIGPELYLRRTDLNPDGTPMTKEDIDADENIVKLTPEKAKEMLGK